MLKIESMQTQNFSFVGNINGVRKELIVKAPVENGAVYTNKYCPKELLTGGPNFSFITADNGETIDGFITDCQKMIMAMECAGIQDSSFDVHVAGLMAVVQEHLSQYGRLIFIDLLIYMDCFSLLLEADGFPENEIREKYPNITRTIVELYPSYILNTADLSLFKGSRFDFALFYVQCK